MALVAALAVVALFIPCALAIAARQLSEQKVEAERDAAIAATAIDAGEPGSAALPQDDAYGLYDRDGRLVHGTGPLRAEANVVAAFTGPSAPEVADGQVVAALAVEGTDPPLVLRVAEPRREARAATLRSIAALGVAAAVIVAGAVAAAWVLASRLARPVEALGRTAARLDEGDFTVATAPSGIDEVDQVARTLAVTGERMQRAIERERAFSADASHQLRTPLTAIRTAVEAEQIAPRPDRAVVLDEVLVQVDRVEATLTSLLALARDTHVDRRPVDVAALVADGCGRWSSAAATAGRPLTSELPEERLYPAVSRAALDQVLDVLLDNALTHGRGRVTVRADRVGDAARLSVEDEGHLGTDPDLLFARRGHGAAGHGIGLHLARALVEAEGGRLRRSATSSTCFEIVLPLDRAGTTRGPAD